MAEKIISPGVFTNEIDQSFLPSAVADIGAALVGPTLKGPAGIPTVVTSFSEFQNKFGDVLKSGSNSYQFLTSHTAEQYLKNSNTLTVVRVMDGTFGPATASIPQSGSDVTGQNFSTGSFIFNVNPSGSLSGSSDEISIGGVDFTFVSSSVGLENTANQVFLQFGTSGNAAANLQESALNLANAITASSLNITASAIGSAKIAISASSAGNQTFTVTTGSAGTTTSKTPSFFSQIDSSDLSTVVAFDGVAGGTVAAGSTDEAFSLKTLSDGSIMDNFSTTATTNNVLLSGSKHNIRYEISNKNEKKGTFTLVIRAGNDNIKRKQTLETFNNVTLDPNSTNYIGKVIGDQRFTVRTDGTTKYLQLTGSFPQKSKFVTVENVNTTIDYLDENGEVRVPAASASLPEIGSGSGNGGFGGGTDGVVGFDALGNNRGSVSNPINFYENIGLQSQGLKPQTDDEGKTGYENALDLLANQDEYDINLILTPGIIANTHTSIASKIIDVCEDRGDCFAVLDPVPFASTLATATTEAETRDSNFAAMYWPWIKVPDSQVAGTQRWVPPSVAIGGIYAFNDKVAHPWFAPAGLNRGGIDIAVQAERKLTQGNRDDLYDSNVNPIATFPGQGVTVFGQKTLQKKASALDRINVRRLLIRVKKFIASSSRFLLFEQNNAALRNRFLNIVNPFLEQVQSQSGLTAFRVVMDGTNNTPDVIDRNQLVGQLFLQPTRTAEFIVLDFVVQPTGAAFPE
tara:strand:+ start:9400 stop:11625 length:2226 start_codon:yes stop_codon:yes gene_type:complete